MATMVYTCMGNRDIVPLSWGICFQKKIITMNQSQKTFRRIVTGHDADGKAIFISDAPPVRAILVGGPGGPHPLMHRTETIDYGIVLEGEITLILDREERNIQAGDIIVQCGTNHAWANRSDKICRIAFMLIDGKFTDEML